MIFVKIDMVAKGISQDDIPDNWVGIWANRSYRMRTMTVSVVYFQEQQVLF